MSDKSPDDKVRDLLSDLAATLDKHRQSYMDDDLMTIQINAVLHLMAHVTLSAELDVDTTVRCFRKAVEVMGAPDDVEHRLH